MKNLQVSLFNNDNTLIAIAKIDHCDIVKSHSVFYMTNPIMGKIYNENSVLRITQTINSIQLIKGKIIIYYSLGYAEIVRY